MTPHNDNPNLLFDSPDIWDGMPEFVQEKKEPFAKIIVRFRTEEDMQEFSRIIGQPLTPNTKSIWHPQRIHRWSVDRVYADES
jgi:hypothetical protein